MRTAQPLATSCHKLPDNEPMADNWARLAEHVITRRVDRGYKTRQAFATASGLSLRTLGDIERHDRDSYDNATLATLESALGWEPGSVQNILTGGKPRTADEDGKPRNPRRAGLGLGALESVMTSDRLDEATKNRLVKLLIAQTRDFDRQLEEQAERMIDTFGSGD